MIVNNYLIFAVVIFVSSIVKEGFGSFLEKKGWLEANVTRICLSFEHFLKK